MEVNEKENDLWTERKRPREIYWIVWDRDKKKME